MDNPFYAYISFSFNGRFYHVTRDTSILKFYFFYWFIKPYKLLNAGWSLTSPKMRIQPIKNGIHVRCYRAIRHMVTWIKWDIIDRERCKQGYFEEKA